MSILHSITSSQRTTAHRAEVFCWPVGTEHTTDDILIGGSSLTAAARDGQTPFVRIGEASSAGGIAPGRQAFVTVLVTRVMQVDHLGVLQRPDIWVDADLGACEPILGAARIIGRTATDRRSKVRMLSETDPDTHRNAKLPADIRAGDLIATPCHGTMPRTYVTGAHFQPSACTVTAIDDPAEDTGFYGVCGK